MGMDPVVSVQALIQKHKIAVLIITVANFAVIEIRVLDMGLGLINRRQRSYFGVEVDKV